MKTNVFYHGDCLTVLSHDIESGSIDLIYLDPPFFTGKVQKGTLKKSDWRPEAMEVSYEDSKRFWKEQGVATSAPDWLKAIAYDYPDFASYLYYMMARLKACEKLLRPTGSIYLHCDEKASHYLKMIMDKIFGLGNFRNELIWCYKGGNATHKFRKKHDTILFYSKSDKYYFNANATRVPYSDKISDIALKDESGRLYYKTGQNESGRVYLHPDGQLPYDWWDDIPSSTASHGKEMLGYPTQKPLKLLERIISASCPSNGVVLDPFGGCGTTAVASHRLNRRWVAVDSNRIAIDATQSRVGQMLTPEQSVSFLSVPIILRDIEAVKLLTPMEFESWVNEFYDATKPNPDRGVDGITPEGIPIQSKSYLVKYDIVSQFATNIQTHPRVPQPCDKGIIASQTGFDDGARQERSKIKSTMGIDLELVKPEDLLNTDLAKRNVNI